VVDAAFGTGFRGEYRFPPCPRALRSWPSTSPRGCTATPARRRGPGSGHRHRDFVALKPGLLQGDGADLAGSVSVADIGLPTGSPAVAAVEDADVAALVPARGRQGNKWSAAVLVVAALPG